MAIVNLVEKIINSLDNMKIVISVFIDLKKAFDTIDHTILLQMLNHYGIRGIVNQSVSSCLSHRKQYVQIKGTNSSKVFYVVFHKVKFSALICLIFILITFLMCHAFWNYVICR